MVSIVRCTFTRIVYAARILHRKGRSVPIQNGDVAHRPTCDRAEVSCWVANRQQCECPDICRQIEDDLYLFIAAVWFVVSTVPKPSARQAKMMFCTSR